MPLLSKMEQKSIYETFLAIRPQKGKWIRLIRIPNSHATTYVSYREDAKFLSYWAGITLLDSEEIPRVQFGEALLNEVQKIARARKYRVIVVDAPTGLATG